MPLSLTRSVGDRIRLRVDRSFAWLTVLGIVEDDVLLRLSNDGGSDEIRLSPEQALRFKLAGKDVEIWVKEARAYKGKVYNQVRLSFGGDQSIEVLREELLDPGFA
jgi:hypothetical protein